MVARVRTAQRRSPSASTNGYDVGAASTRLLGLPARQRVDTRDLGLALDGWGRFTGPDGRERAPGSWIRSDGDLVRARADRTELDLLRVDASRFVVHRTPDFTARTVSHHIIVVQLEGRSTLHPGDGSDPVTLEPGQASYGDPAVPYRWEFEGPLAVMLVRLPYAAFSLPPAALRAVLGRPFRADAGLGGAAVAYARDVLDDEHRLGGADAPRILHRAIANFESPLLDRVRTTESDDLSRHAFLRALDHIAGHLHEPLAPPSIAEATGMSARYLQAIFQQRGMTVTSWIKQRRLEVARQVLADPASLADDLTAIALAHGFADHSHFTRNFRIAYGETPSAWRDRSARRLAA